jgi:hypothetical protein
MSEDPRKRRWLDWTLRVIYIAIILALLLLLWPGAFVRVRREAIQPDDHAWQELQIRGSRHAQRLQRARLAISEILISD